MEPPPNPGNLSFSAIAGRSSGVRKPTAEFTKADFPALGDRPQTREELLMSNLLGFQTQKPARKIGTIGVREVEEDPSLLSQVKSYADVSIPVRNSFKPSSNGQELIHDPFGLFGLIDIIRMTNEDLTMLSLGSDLTSLGLPLNSGDSIYSSFMTPFSDLPLLGAEPDVDLPDCYTTSPPPMGSRLSLVSDEALFYIFYSLTRTLWQEGSAQELYTRGWRFHKELKLWLSHDGPDYVKSGSFEKGSYLFFDPSSWSKVKKEWVVQYEHLEERESLSDLSRLSLEESVNVNVNARPWSRDLNVVR